MHSHPVPAARTLAVTLAFTLLALLLLVGLAGCGSRGGSLVTSSCTATSLFAELASWRLALADIEREGDAGAPAGDARYWIRHGGIYKPAKRG